MCLIRLQGFQIEILLQVPFNSRQQYLKGFSECLFRHILLIPVKRRERLPQERKRSRNQRRRRSIAYSSDLKTALPGKTLDFYQTRLVEWQRHHDPREEILMPLSVPVLRILFWEIEINIPGVQPPLHSRLIRECWRPVVDAPSVSQSYFCVVRATHNSKAVAKRVVPHFFALRFRSPRPQYFRKLFFFCFTLDGLRKNRGCS